MIQHVTMIVHENRQDAYRYANKAKAFFSDHDIAVTILPEEQPDSPPDLIMAFGGDGTLLRGARYALLYQAPLLGVNLGTVGFLTEIEPERIDACLEALLEGRFLKENRSLLSVTFQGKTCLALNDAVITRGGYARLIRVQSYINTEKYYHFTADGVIVATPTGSTGYSLSAGGPIVEPGLDCMIMTPVCAHSLQHCPCIVSGKSVIRLSLLADREQTAELQIDGQNWGTLRGGDEISVTGTDQKIQLIRMEKQGFFSVVQQKLSEWGSASDFTERK